MKSNIAWFKNFGLTGVVMALFLLLTGCGPGQAEAGAEAARVVEPAPTDIASAPTASATPINAEGQPVVIESGGEVPFYARFGENETFDNGDWTVIVFYRPPECIPADFNLIQFFHFPGENSPGAFACAPPTTTSVETWQNGPEADPVPLISEMMGRGAVPVWFLANDEVASIMADGIVPIGELAELPSRLVGAAAAYTELLRPTQSNAEPLIQFAAEGSLDDGRAFKVDVSKGAQDVEDHVTIDISE